MALNADAILRAFTALSEELERRNEHGRIVVVGGAALVLLFEARESTKDVDAYFVRPEASVIRDAAATVAARLELPNDWLNDAAKAYLVVTTLGAVLYQSPHLEIRAATTAQLLAMKLAAWRDAIDRSDAKLLLSEMDGSASEIWSLVQRYVPPHLLDKASYAFEDLWESVHGPS
jgi:Nucleotidyltransferase of unknown function (DUF6036)